MLSLRKTLAATCAVGLAMVGAVSVSAPASAVPANYSVSIVMLEGDNTTEFTVTGTFTFDPELCGSEPCVDAYSDISISVPARPYSSMPAITYTKADICPTEVGPNCNGQPQSGASMLSLATDQTVGQIGYYQALTIGFSPSLSTATPGINLGATTAYSETGEATAVSGTVTNVTPQPEPEPVVAQVPTAGSVFVPTKLARQGSKKIASANPVTNAAQKVRVKVSCKVSTRGDLRVCSKVKTKKGTFVRTYGVPAKVRITWSAPAVEGFTAYRQVQSYKV